MKRLFHWTNHGPYLIPALLAVVFAALLGMEIFLAGALIERENLEVMREAERSFNTIYMALTDGSMQKARDTMREEEVLGIGVYSSTGRRVLYLGSVPPVMDLAALGLSDNPDLSTGIARYQVKSGNIEYTRLSTLHMLFETGNLAITPDGKVASPIDFPDILYLNMDGSAYHGRVVGIRFLATIATLLLIGIYLLVIRYYLVNRAYRDKLARQEQLVSLGQAARTLTHEIKNPLSAIILQLAILKKTSPESSHGQLDMLEHEVKRLVALTNKVSSFLRNPVGTPQPIHLGSFIQELTGTFGHPVSLSVEGEDLVSIDPERARSVFENLIKNAMESRSDGTDPQVEVKLTQEKKSVRVCVMDRGDGLSKAAEKQLFDPFFTTKIHGSGIGLAISRQFVTARGGTIRLYNREGGGTVAEVTLPLWEEKR